MQEEKSSKLMIGKIFIMIAILASGFLGAFLLCLINHAEFGIRTWPIILCIDACVFTTIGFFISGGKQEKMYGICSIVSAACLIMQMAVVF